jgi:hypothetical protein
MDCTVIFLSFDRFKLYVALPVDVRSYDDSPLELDEVGPEINVEVSVKNAYALYRKVNAKHDMR